MKRIVLLSLIALFAFQVQAKDKRKPAGYEFKDTKVVPHTSVKNQYRSGTCWSFSGLAFFEAELMREGKGEMDLSEMFVVWHSYMDKAVKYVRMHGTINFGGGGAFNDIIDVINKYGMVTEEAYHGIQYKEANHVHGEMDILLKNMVDAIIKNKNRKLTPVWPAAIANVLTAYLGELPEKFNYKGAEYTPRTFADKAMALDMNDYTMMSSYTHHPFYKPFVIEVQDNWAWGEVHNVKLDEMMQTIDYAIENGYTVAWAADVSEDGFKWSKGRATVPDTEVEILDGMEQDKWEKMSDRQKKVELLKADGPVKEMEITQELRQEGFDNYQTTDDHGMLIVGIAKDQNGNKYYKVKNSWGTKQVYEGYFYASEAFVAYKTMSLLINKNSIPQSISSKLEL